MTTLRLDLDDDLVALLRQQDPSVERAAREPMVMELDRRGVRGRTGGPQTLITDRSQEHTPWPS